MKVRTTLAAASLLLVSLLVLSACGQQPPTATPTTSQGTGTNQELQATQEPGPTEEAGPTGDSPASPAPIPDGPLTIVALGDSLTEGDADYPGDGGGYPARLQRSINEIRPNSQVINLGKSGWDSAQMLEGQLPAALEANPHIALIWIGSNDLWYNNGPEQEAADLDRYTNNIDTALRDLTGTGARVFIALLDDQSQRPYTTSPDGAGLSAEGVEHMSRLVSAFNDAISAKAAEYGATTVDFYNTTIFTDPSTLAEDGIHPNPNGYDVIAQIWFEAIRGDL
jgi:acyl-CoA thioesterase I